eukprot:TRINITY_DN6453_c0_g1_i10.p1 TRINITY_DN6453_c0_g1~~TRINITY_DN6453_c0_g1_i10.p1  ORF type:complete len:121 (+),score=13.08 TRINITY_DN6453_c0_g1_i10:192-554(+)
MISAETPMLFAKVCEMFITELTYRAWFFTEENKRRTLQRADVGTAIIKTDIFDFLADVIPKESLEAQALSPEFPLPAQPLKARPSDSLVALSLYSLGRVRTNEGPWNSLYLEGCERRKGK